ncbi:MAG: RHS repeat protein [Rhodospirillales bacterium]|nr:MAG: RHS repeat protein [Rhodospirillales bacterium]
MWSPSPSSARWTGYTYQPGCWQAPGAALHWQGHCPTVQLACQGYAAFWTGTLLSYYRASPTSRNWICEIEDIAGGVPIIRLEPTAPSCDPGQTTSGDSPSGCTSGALPNVVAAAPPNSCQAPGSTVGGTRGPGGPGGSSRPPVPASPDGAMAASSANGVGVGPATTPNPIDVRTGNKFLVATDFATVGDNPLVFTRFYNSLLGQVAATDRLARPESSLGSGWTSTYDRAVVFYSDTRMELRRPNGAIAEFWRGSTANPVLAPFDDTFGGLLTPLGGGGYTYVDAEGTTEAFDAGGRLTSITTREGYVQTLAYDAGTGRLTTVTDNQGRALAFTYDAAGKLETMTGPDGRVTRYAYESYPFFTATRWRLVKVIHPDATPGDPDDNPRVEYKHEDAAFPQAITGIVDEKGVRIATYAYEALGRATLSEGADGQERYLVGYGAWTGSGNYTATMVNPLGRQTVYTIQPANSTTSPPRIVRIDGHATANCAAGAATFTWSGAWATGTIDEEGTQNTYGAVVKAYGRSLNAFRESANVAATDRTVTYTYNAAFLAPDRIEATGRWTDFTYTVGRTTQVKWTDKQTQSIPYSTTNRTRIWDYTYTATGLVQTVNGPRIDVVDLTTYAYDSAGHLASVTNALGQVTTVNAVDGRGMPLTVTDPNGVVTTLAYDARGRLTSMTAASGTAAAATTTIAWDAASLVTRITRPDGSYLDFGYDDAQRPVSVTDNTGQRIEYTLDRMGGATATVVKESGGTVRRQMTAAFDELGRLMRSIGAAGQTTAYAYDRLSRNTGEVDPLSRTTTSTFDALGRLSRVADPAGGQTRLTYDKRDNPLTITDSRGLVTTNVFDGFDNLIQTTSPDTGVTVNHYDEAGNLTRAIDARGVSTWFTYDALNRVTSRRYAAPPGTTADDVTFTYDDPTAGNFGIGRLTGIVDPAGTSAFAYDARGNLVRHTRVQGGLTLVTSYTYDLSDRVASVTYPSGRVVEHTRDALGQITQAVTRQTAGGTPTTLASAGTYRPFGPLTGLTLGNGLTLSAAYDLDYRLTNLTVGPGVGASVLNLTYAYDAVDNVLTLSDAVTPARDQTLGYDALDRLTSATGQYGSLLYAYDIVGNRSSSSIGGVASTYTYPATSNRLTSIAGGVTRSFTYSASGNALTDVRAGGTWTLGYGPDDRLRTVTQAGATLATYAHDGLGQRARRTAGAIDRHYVYDQEGMLLAEIDVSGATFREHIAMDGMPLAVVVTTAGTPAIFWVHADRLGTAQKMTDATGAVVWDLHTAPFGELATLTATAPASNDNRFPGQIADPETGYSYNLFRDYDPRIGRYVQSDPIGLLGGMNTYAYVGGNPLSYIDPTGEHIALVVVARVALPMIRNALLGASIGGGFSILSQYNRTGRGCADINWADVRRDAAWGAALSFAVAKPLPPTLRQSGPRPPKNFVKPTNPPATPEIPSGWVSAPTSNGRGTVWRAPGTTGSANTIRIMRPNESYPTGYWVRTNGRGQPTNPATGGTGARWETHIPLP